MSSEREILEHLCAYCDEEAERQETVLSVCRAQLEAARAHDLELLEAKTAALLLLVREAAESEKQRLALVKAVVDHYGLPVERQTLTSLIQIVPLPWSARLAEFQTRLRATVAEARKTSRETHRIARKSLRIIDRAVAAATLCSNYGPGIYDAQGNETKLAPGAVSFFNQAG